MGWISEFEAVPFTSLHRLQCNSTTPLHFTALLPQLHFTASPLLPCTSVHCEVHYGTSLHFTSHCTALHTAHYCTTTILQCTVLTTLHFYYFTALQPQYSNEFHCTVSTTLHPHHSTALHCTTHYTAHPLIHCISRHSSYYTAPPLLHGTAPLYSAAPYLL